MKAFRLAAALCACAAVFTPAVAGGHNARHAKHALLRPMISDFQYLGNGTSPPTQAACNAVARRCFNPTSIANSYNYAALHNAGEYGREKAQRERLE